MKSIHFYDIEKLNCFGSMEEITLIWTDRDEGPVKRYTLMLIEPDAIALRSHLTGKVCGFDVGELIDEAIKYGIDTVKEV